MLLLSLSPDVLEAFLHDVARAKHKLYYDDFLKVFPNKSGSKRPNLVNFRAVPQYNDVPSFRSDNLL